MKLSRNILFSVMSLALTTSAFAQKQDHSSAMPQMRKYKENEAGLSYTFSRVNLGGLNNLPAFVQYDGNGYINYPDQRTIFRNLKMHSAYEFAFNYLQTLEDSAHKVFFDVNYIHADGKAKADVPSPSGTNNFFTCVHSFLGGDYLENHSANLPYFSDMKVKFDLASAQSGVYMRLYRTKNIDFSVFGGVDVAYFTTNAKINVLGYDAWEGEGFVYAKGSQYVNVVADRSQLSEVANDLANTNDSSEYSRSIKSNYYGAGPLLGAKLQVPFNKEFLRLNVKLEASALMGYGSSYFNYDNAYLAVIYDVSGDVTSASEQWPSRTNNEHKHVFRLVPTLRGEISLDVIIKNFMFTAGLQQAVYFQALDINPLADFAEWRNPSNINEDEFMGTGAASTRDRLGQITTGGPFVKLSVLF
jgi:Legionella pneumophila major outer membrane protein precursor